MPAILRVKTEVSPLGARISARTAHPSEIGEDIRYSEGERSAEVRARKRHGSDSVEWPFCVRNVTHAGGVEG